MSSSLQNDLHITNQRLIHAKFYFSDTNLPRSEDNFFGCLAEVRQLVTDLRRIADTLGFELIEHVREAAENKNPPTNTDLPDEFVDFCILAKALNYSWRRK